MLLAKLVPTKGLGNTEFASQYLAYEKLPNDYKKKIENLKGVFSSSGPIAVTRLEREKEKGTGKAKDFEAIHGIVKTINNRKAIYCSPGHVTNFLDLDEKEAKKLQDFLFKHQVKKEFVYAFKWEKNSIAMWDNRSMLHQATPFSGDRIMHRITIQ
jgi:taurine dioxygenase